MSDRNWRVRNWEHFQHYKDRSPPWIKMYGDLLNDYDFGQLPDASKGHLVCLFLLASRTKGVIPDDPAWVARQISATVAVDLQLLARHRFLELEQVSSNPLADCQQNAPLAEQNRGEERREEKMLLTDLATACAIAANQGLRDNPRMGTLASTYPLSATSAQAATMVADWTRDGIDRETILAAVTTVARNFKPTKPSPRISSFGYFDRAVREAWAAKQAVPPAPARKGFRVA